LVVGGININNFLKETGMVNFKISIFITALFVVSMAESTASAISCDTNVTEPNFYVYGLCFSPYVDGQKPPDYVSPEQIHERLAIMTKKHHADWIRTYSAIYGLENIPEEAKSLGFKVAMGVWIRDNKEQEIDNLVAAAQAGYVDMAVVGNEELYGHATSEANLIKDINDVRQRLIDAGCGNIPVTTPEPYYTLFATDGKGSCSAIHPQLINAVDVVLINIYPFLDGNYIDVALQDLPFRYQCVADAVKAIDLNKKR
jgi:exo-beta-1,3-glucanase (GH17 family)